MHARKMYSVITKQNNVLTDMHKYIQQVVQTCTHKTAQHNTAQCNNVHVHAHTHGCTIVDTNEWPGMYD